MKDGKHEWHKRTKYGKKDPGRLRTKTYNFQHFFKVTALSIYYYSFLKIYDTFPQMTY